MSDTAKAMQAFGAAAIKAAEQLAAFGQAWQAEVNRELARLARQREQRPASRRSYGPTDVGR